MKGTEKLAIEGGTPVVQAPPPDGRFGGSLIGDEEISAVTDVLRSGRLSPYGDSEVVQFEREAAEFLGVEYAVMLNSGTSGLVSSLTAVGTGLRDGDHLQRGLPAEIYLSLLGLYPGQALAAPLGLPLERSQLQEERRVLQRHVPSDPFDSGSGSALRL